jgi:hypothetical protein
VNDLVRRLAKLYRDATLTSGASAASLSERVKESKPGASLLGFDEDPLPVRLEDALERFLVVWEEEVAGTGAERVRDQDKTSAARKAKTRAVLADVGMDPTAVAFVHGMTTEGVRKLRGRHGRDPDTGVRLTELRQERVDGEQTHPSPLTAPGRFASERLAHTTTTEDQ